MGQTCSSIDHVNGTTSKNVQSIYLKLGLNFSSSKWETVHNTGSILAQQEAIEEATKGQPIGCDLQRISSLPNEHRKCVLICCNTYNKPEYSLGVGPMNDTLAVTSFMRNIGFQVFFIHNPTPNEFLHYFKHFVGCTKEYLLVYYTGHGGSIENTNNNEKNDKAEVLIFDENFITDDILSEAIANSGKPESSTVCFLNDCCHNGSIFNFELGYFKGMRMPPKIFSISAIREPKSSTQTSVGQKDQGIFTFYFFKLLLIDNELTPLSIEPKINQYLEKYNQKYICTSTSPEILNQAVFQ